MIKKTKDCYKQIEEKIENGLDWNKTHNTVSSRINVTCVEISRGLYNSFDKSKLKQYENVKFQLIDNDDYCQLLIRFE
ncbi:MAG: hypothetical protein J6S67_17650 [Methanobrevibacter sp.]|nr:hypothetical protein [Methanobrevibacter sp.]